MGNKQEIRRPPWRSLSAKLVDTMGALGNNFEVEVRPDVALHWSCKYITCSPPLCLLDPQSKRSRLRHVKTGLKTALAKQDDRCCTFSYSSKYEQKTGLTLVSYTLNVKR
jgi:hypothetical protein